MTATFQRYETLSESEKTLLGLLEEVNTDNLWSVAIQRVCASGDPARLRRLICELKSQANDNAEVMERILGTAAYKQLMSI